MTVQWHPIHWLFVALALASCAQDGQREAPTAWLPIQPPLTRCFLLANPDSATAFGACASSGIPLYIRISLLSELANGTVHEGAGQNAAIGNFTGTLENGLVTALCTYHTERGIAKAEVLFKMEAHGLRVATGETVESQGIRLFKNKENTTYGPLIPEVTCQ